MTSPSFTTGSSSMLDQTSREDIVSVGLKKKKRIRSTFQLKSAFTSFAMGESFFFGLFPLLDLQLCFLFSEF